jgi:hypothetical protein
MNPLVIGVVLFAWGLYVYRNMQDEKINEFFDKDSLPFKVIRLDFLKLAPAKLLEYSKYAMGIGAAFLGLAYLKYNKEQRMQATQKTFMF